jgi:Ca2+-binding EF-hand superfamily protein
MDWKNKLSGIQNRIRFQLHSRLYDGIEGVLDFFQVSPRQKADLDKNGSLSRFEFEKMLGSVGIFLSTQELSELFRYYDKNNDQQICIPEFLTAITDSLNERRRSAITQAWQLLKEIAPTVVTTEWLSQRYNSSQHPRVVTREKTADQVAAEFGRSIERYAERGVVTEEGFFQYCNALSATAPKEHDEYFVDLLVKTWDLGCNPAHPPVESILRLEDILYEKIRQRTKPTEDEGRAILRVFRFFDSDNSGAVTITEFKSALERFGCTFSSAELTALFRYYDLDRSGKLDYEELSKAMAKKGSAQTDQFGQGKDIPVAVLEKLRKELLQRGIYGIRGIGQVFRRMDSNKDDCLDRHEFEWGLRESGHRMSPMDLDRLFRYFDRNHDDRISHDEFLVALRGDINDARRVWVRKAWLKVDPSSQGKAALSVVGSAYDPTHSPKVRARLVPQWSQYS